MRKEVYPIRLAKPSKSALEAAAASKGIAPRTLAQEFIDAGLMRAGFLPRSPRKAQPAAQA